MVDIALEYGVGCEQKYLTGVKVVAMLVKQIRNTLHKYRGFTTTRNAIYQKSRHFFMANDQVLLFLDGGSNGLHMRGAALRKRCQQKRILNSHTGIKVCVKRVCLNVELTTQLQVHPDSSTIGLIGRWAVILIVVHLSYR